MVIFIVLTFLALGSAVLAMFSVGYWACLMKFGLKDDYRVWLWRMIHWPLLVVTLLLLLAWGISGLFSDRF